MYDDHRVVGAPARLPGFIPCYRHLGSQTDPADGIPYTLLPVSDHGYVASISHCQFSRLIDPHLGFLFQEFNQTPLRLKGLMFLYCFANFFQNFGPNVTTFIIPGEVFPTRYRATGHGFSAACGKLGAIVAQSIFFVQGNSIETMYVLFKQSRCTIDLTFSPFIQP
jgi:hypothetical protein